MKSKAHSEAFSRTLAGALLDFKAAVEKRDKAGANLEYAFCSGQPIPDSGLSFSSATAGGNPSLN
ncbi:TPA: hypothetical protein NIG94_005306 [Pseudomonas aeruginosa]|nr:hypothetical protein [Pseudomonas aeruginosa]